MKRTSLPRGLEFSVRGFCVRRCLPRNSLLHLPLSFVFFRRSQKQPTSAEQQPSSNPDTVTGEELTGAASGEVGEKEENAQFKYSKSVVWIGHLVGLGPHAAYLVYWFLNFVLVVLFFVLLFRSSVPQMFRDRTQAIQKGIREAQAASADATRRLSDIEARLAKLDSEVAEIRSSAEREAAAEEQRIRPGRRRRQAQGIGRR